MRIVFDGELDRFGLLTTGDFARQPKKVDTRRDAGSGNDLARAYDAFVGLGLRAHNLQYAHFVPVRGSGRTRKLAFGESSQTERLRGFYIAICYFLSRALSSSVMQASRQAAAIARPRGPCFLFNSRCITTPCSIIMIGYATCAALLSSTPARTR